MNFKKLFILILVISIIISVNAVSAYDVNYTAEEVSDQEVIDDAEVDQQDDELGQDVMDLNQQNDDFDNEVLSDDTKVIYVDQNSASGGGNGSYENPFSTLGEACENTNGEKEVIINIFNGTYVLSSSLTFNADNLILNGLGNVIIKNNNSGVRYCLGLKSSSANFTVNNIVFNSSTYMGPSFVTAANYGTYNNCTFLGSPISHLHITSNQMFHYEATNTKFIKCVFKDYSSTYLSDESWIDLNSFIYFENCVMDMSVDSFVNRIDINKNFTLNGIWFGYNGIPDYVTSILASNNGVWVAYDRKPVSKFAVFSVTENYLGNNQYEIIGKLVWNGTDESVGDSFAPMLVKLSSSTGYIQDNITLKEGIFRTTYVSNSCDNSISCVLDQQTINLNFLNVDVKINSPSIFCGDNQNITINFNRLINGNVYININNTIYRVKVKDSSEINFPIPKTLKVGHYLVNVSISQKGVYGFNSSAMDVYKVSDYEFLQIIPAEVNVDEIVSVVVELPKDVTGIVYVIVGNTTFSAPASPHVKINISGLTLGNNLVNVVYSGDDKYISKSFENYISVEKVELKITDDIITHDVIAGTTTPIFAITLPNDATGNLTVIINNKTYTQELVKGSATVNMDELAPGQYTATVIYSGDDKYNPTTTNTNVSIPKPVLTAKNFSMLYTSGSKYTVRVTLDGKAVAGKVVTFVINGKKTTATTDKNGYASVKIDLAPKTKAYSVSASYLGVKVNNKVTVKSIVSAKNVNVKKSAKSLKIKVTLKKVNNKYLKSKQVTIKFNGKTYKAKTNTKGVATFTINKKALSKLKAGKKYSYKVTYGKDMVNKVILKR